MLPKHIVFEVAVKFGAVGEETTVTIFVAELAAQLVVPSVTLKLKVPDVLEL